MRARRGWTLIPQLAAPGERRNVPDGTVRDENSLPRGYWEAKDSGDDLKAEIAKKIARGYPVTNTNFCAPNIAELRTRSKS